MLEIVHIRVTSHFFWFKQDNHEWPSLLRVRWAPPVAVIGSGAAGRSSCGGVRLLSAAADSGDSSPAGSRGEALVALP